MLRYFAIASVAVVGLFTVAAVPAEAGASTGSWKYWTPYTAHAAPPHWPHARGYDGRGYGHRGYHAYRGGYPAKPPHGHAYDHRRHPHGW